MTLVGWSLEVRFPEEATEGEVVVPKNAPRPPDSRRPGSSGADPEVEITYVPTATNSSVSGESRRSFYQDGFYNRQDLVVNLNHRGEDGVYLRAQLGTLYSDDPQLRAGGPVVRFPSAFVEVGQRDNFDVRVGQLPVNLSRYSFFRQVDGVRGRLLFPDDLGRWSLEGVLSRAQTPRGLDRFQRTAHGARVGREFLFEDESFMDWLRVGANASWVSDQHGSLSQRERNGLPVVNGQVTSFDLSARLRGGWQLDGEYGFSQATVSGDNSVFGQGDFEGRAGRIGLRYFRGAWSGGADYERVSPGFRSLVGAAAADLERTNAYLGYSITPEIRLDGAWRTSRNNLSQRGLSTFETSVVTTGARLTPFAQSEVDALRPLSFDVGYSANNTRLGAFSDRNTDEMSFAIGYYFGPAALTLSHRDRDTVDGINSTFDRREQIQTARLSYRVPLGEGWAVTPSVGTTFSRALAVQAGTTAQNDNLTYGVSADLGRQWRFDYAQNVMESLHPSLFLTRDSLNISRRASLNYLPKAGDDLSLGLQWADRRLSDTLPGTDVASNQFTALLRSRF